MKLYDHLTAPNPRRVRVYLAEKGIEVERVNIDIMSLEHKTPEFIEKNLNGQIPVLELDDGNCISESVSICRYLEALHPAPALFGSTPLEVAKIDMHRLRDWIAQPFDRHQLRNLVERDRHNHDNRQGAVFESVAHGAL